MDSGFESCGTGVGSLGLGRGVPRPVLANEGGGKGLLMPGPVKPPCAKGDSACVGGANMEGGFAP